MNQEVLDKLKDQLVTHEGFKQTIYFDSVGIPTIGVGHNLNTPISKKVVELILEDDIKARAAQVDQALPWLSSLDPVRQQVIYNMAFNLGAGGILNFRNTLAALKRGDYDVAADAMLSSKWAKQVGNRATELANMMRTGK